MLRWIQAGLQRLCLRERYQWLADRLPSWYQWKHFFKILSKKEFYLFWIMLVIFGFSFTITSYQWYLRHTEIKPLLSGSLAEGIIGSPRFINPVLSSANDPDRDLAQLVFSSLLKYDEKSQLVPDLAETYSILDNGKIYEITLKKNIRWHDKKPFNVDDVIFTLNLIQGLDYKSPLRVSWAGVEVEKADDYTIRFRLKNAYAPFLHNLTFGILPKHIWKDISPANFSLSTNNLKPVGTGPYKFRKIVKDKKTGSVKLIELEVNKNYYLPQPFIKSLKFIFYKDETAALDAFNRKEIDSLGLSSARNLSKIKRLGANNLHSFTLPRYFAIFFNQEENKALVEKNIRLAINYATDKQELIAKVLNGKALIIDSPILPGLFTYSSSKKYDFDLEKAKNTLESSGWKDADSDGIREKEAVKLEINLLTTQRPDLVETATILREQWAKAGIKLNIETKETSDLQQDFIKPRQYQALLFGEALGLDPDPFAFWHSSQKNDPGLNLALYANRDVDKLLEEARKEINSDARGQKYDRFQNLVLEDMPAVFLFSPHYNYLVNKKIKGINNVLIATPSGRFSQIGNWYIKAKRSWK